MGGFGPSALCLRDILAYLTEIGIDDPEERAELLVLLQALDRVYRSHAAKLAEAEAEKARR